MSSICDKLEREPKNSKKCPDSLSLLLSDNDEVCPVVDTLDDCLQEQIRRIQDQSRSTYDQSQEDTTDGGDDCVVDALKINTADVDLKDDQSGTEDPLNTNVLSWPMCFRANTILFNSGFASKKSLAYARIGLVMPDNEQASLFLRLVLPYSMDPTTNPAQLAKHCVLITFYT